MNERPAFREIPNNYKEAAFLGREHEKSAENKINKVASRIYDAGVLKPETENRDTKLADIIREEFNHGYDNLSDLNARINSGTELQKENARQDKEILGKAIYWVMNSGVDQELQTRLALGVFKTEEVFPDTLKNEGNLAGNNKRISEVVVGNLIQDSKVNEELGKLDKFRKMCNLANENQRNKLVSKIHETSDALFDEMCERGVDIEEDPKNDLFVAKQYLDMEAGILSGELNTEDNSADKDDVKAATGNDKVAEAILAAAEKMGQAAEKISESGAGQGRNGRHDYQPPYKNAEGDWDGGSRWEISPEYAADAMNYMDEMRWQSYTPPEWMKKLDPMTQARIEYMVMVNDGAHYLNRAGKDLDRIRNNPLYFAFDNEKMTKLFNDDFKLACSKMLNDLCEFYTDRNGRQSLKYKEGVNKKGDLAIDEEVRKKLENIRTYKEEIADTLAKKNGRDKANYMDKMNAYTAWNMFFMFGDSSLADRMRVLPTYGGIINDGIRTLNTEYKARVKWRVSKGDNPISGKDDLTEAEWFGGQLGAYIQTVMEIEKKAGALDKKTGKTMRDKINEGKLKVLASKTCYGFFDFTTGGRELYDQDGKKFYNPEEGRETKVTLAQLLRNYGHYKDGNFVKNDESKEFKEFSFGHNEVDFMNWFRDQQEAAALVFNCSTGKADAKDVGKWVNDVRTALGMINGIGTNGSRVFKYTNSPDAWANIILGTFGVDMTRLSTDHIRLKTQVEGGYNLYVRNFLTKTLRLTEDDVDIREVMRYLGVSIKDGEKVDSMKVTFRNDAEWANERRVTGDLKRKFGNI